MSADRGATTLMPSERKGAPRKQPEDAEISISKLTWTRDARLPVRLHYLALAAGAVALFYFNRHQWFAADEWTFIPQRGEPGFRPGIFVPHNEHWVTIPALVYRALFGLFGARSYLPYIGVLVALHLLATHLLYRVIYRTKATAWMALGMSSVFLTLGAGSENLLWAFQISFVGSFAFGLLFVLLVDHSSAFGTRDKVAWVAALAALMCSGVGLTMVLVAAIAVLLRRGARTSLLVCGPPILAYAIWFAVVGHEGVNTDTPITKDTFLDMPAFILNGLAATLEGMSGYSGAGPALVLMLVAVVAWQAWGGSRQCLPLALGAGAVMLFFTAGLARIPENGPAFFDAPRYIYLATGLLVPMVAIALSALPQRSIGRVAILPIALVFVIAHGLSTLDRSANETAAQAQVTRRSILAQAELIRSGATILRGDQRARIFVRPDAVHAPGLALGELVQMVENDQVPEGETLT